LIRTHPYAHPLHMNVVKQFFVFDNEVGAILDGYSLNILTTLLLAPREVSIRILGNFRRLGGETTLGTSSMVMGFDKQKILNNMRKIVAFMACMYCLYHCHHCNFLHHLHEKSSKMGEKTQ
jgi:hypothetical protein